MLLLLAFAAAGSVGLLLGFWLRAPALIAASGVIAVVCLSVAPFTELRPASAVGLTFALLSALQIGYLIGLMLSCAWARMRLSRSGHVVLAGTEGVHTGRAKQLLFSLAEGCRRAQRGRAKWSSDVHSSDP
jgi:hypothetical protein